MIIETEPESAHGRAVKVSCPRREADPGNHNSVTERSWRRPQVPRAPSVGTEGGPTSGGIRGLRVKARDGKVILKGTVRSQAQKDRAGSRAAAVVGKQNVDNQLIVK